MNQVITLFALFAIVVAAQQFQNFQQFQQFQQVIPQKPISFTHFTYLDINLAEKVQKGYQHCLDSYGDCGLIVTLDMYLCIKKHMVASDCDAFYQTRCGQIFNCVTPSVCHKSTFQWCNQPTTAILY